MLIPSATLRLLLALLALTTPLRSQQQDPKLTITRSHRIVQLAAEVRVDGRLDEPAWSKVEAVTGFVQADPNEGAPASERTEVFLFYDERKIYFGFKCYESEPKKIIARLDTHDARTNSDSVNIFLDPYGDRRTGYFFSINARGVQYDALISEASGFDGTWDGIWESAAQIEDWGWTAEVAIPFKSIRLTPGQTWGLNLSRDVVRKNETAYWQFVARFEGFPPRPSKAGLLDGIEQVERGRNLEVIPYFSTRARRGAVSPIDNGEGYEGGVDVRWGLLPYATLNVTVNPDFAETEADEANITISRFEIFFPEKRAFFNEGSTFFSTPLDLFFTRRVGARLPDGRPQRILLGAKLTGKVQGWSLGMMEARTEETDFRDPATGAQLTSPGANFFVLRGQRDIFRNSSIGFLTVNRDQSSGDVGSTQRVHGVDLNIIGGPYFKWTTQASYNQNDSTRSGIQRVGFKSEAFYNTDHWGTGGGYKYLGRGFDVSAIGFEPESDRHSAFAFGVWKPFLDRAGIRQIFFELNQDISIDTEGLTQDSGSDADLRAQFQNFWSARVRYSYDLVRFNEFTTTPNCPAPFGCSPAFGRLAPTRAYLEPRLRFFLNSNENRAWYFNYEFLKRKTPQFRENFYGREQSHFISVTGRMFGRTRVQFNGRWIRELLQDGTPFQMRRQFLARVQHQFTRKLRVRTLAQVTNDRLGQNFSMNSIVAYDFTARSAAIVGYNYQKGAPGRPGDLGNEFFAKFSYLFQF